MEAKPVREPRLALFVFGKACSSLTLRLDWPFRALIRAFLLSSSFIEAISPSVLHSPKRRALSRSDEVTTEGRRQRKTDRAGTPSILNLEDTTLSV